MSQTQKNNQLNSGKVAVAAVGTGLSFILDLFIMTCLPNMNLAIKLVLIGVISVIFLICAYVLINSIVRIYNRMSQRDEEIYEDLYKSSKATYLLMRKAFQEMDEILVSMEEKVGAPMDEIMEAQKNVAKVTISRNKENADALMNSNDKLLDKMFDFESTLESLEENVLSKQKELMDSSMKDVAMKQQELAMMIKDLELELRKEMSSISVQSAAPVVQAVPQVEAPQVMETPEVEEIPQMIEMETPVMPTSETASSEISDEDLEKMLASTEDGLFAEMQEEATADVISFEAPEEVNLDALSFESSEEPSFEEELLPGFDESLGDDFMGDDILAGLDDLLADDFATTDNVADESVEDILPDLLEGLADLTAEVEAEDVMADFTEDVMPELEEPVAEEVEAEVEEEVTEKPPMPDLSDPNKVMSPEDIAALIANL